MKKYVTAKMTSNNVDGLTISEFNDVAFEAELKKRNLEIINTPTVSVQGHEIFITYEVKADKSSTLPADSFVFQTNKL